MGTKPISIGQGRHVDEDPAAVGGVQVIAKPLAGFDREHFLEAVHVEPKDGRRSPQGPSGNPAIVHDGVEAAFNSPAFNSSDRPTPRTERTKEMLVANNKRSRPASCGTASEVAESAQDQSSRRQSNPMSTGLAAGAVVAAHD